MALRFAAYLRLVGQTKATAGTLSICVSSLGRERKIAPAYTALRYMSCATRCFARPPAPYTALSASRIYPVKGMLSCLGRCHYSKQSQNETSGSPPTKPSRTFSISKEITTLPNLLTLSRLLVTPYLGYAIVQGNAELSIALFAYCSVTDWVSCGPTLSRDATSIDMFIG
jgi:hypothetical protein